jgi:hypothetical protein
LKISLIAALIFIGFSSFAIWRDLVYTGASIGSLADFILDFEDAGLLYKIIEHGILAHFVVMESIPSAIDFVETHGHHYGIDYILQILRLIGLGSILNIPASIDLEYNAFLRGVSVMDLQALDAGGVVIGLPGSFYIAGGGAGLVIGSVIWSFFCSIMIKYTRRHLDVIAITLLPYVLVIYQSPETNIPRLAIIVASLWAITRLTNVCFMQQGSKLKKL